MIHVHVIHIYMQIIIKQTVHLNKGNDQQIYILFLTFNYLCRASRLKLVWNAETIEEMEILKHLVFCSMWNNDWNKEILWTWSFHLVRHINHWRVSFSNNFSKNYGIYIYKPWNKMWFQKISIPTTWKVFSFEPSLPPWNSQLTFVLCLRNFGCWNPLPLRISNNPPWSGYGYFVEPQMAVVFAIHRHCSLVRGECCTV